MNTPIREGLLLAHLEDCHHAADARAQRPEGLRLMTRLRGPMIAVGVLVALFGGLMLLARAGG